MQDVPHTSFKVFHCLFHVLAKENQLLNPQNLTVSVLTSSSSTRKLCPIKISKYEFDIQMYLVFWLYSQASSDFKIKLTKLTYGMITYRISPKIPSAQQLSLILEHLLQVLRNHFLEKIPQKLETRAIVSAHKLSAVPLSAIKLPQVLYFQQSKVTQFYQVTYFYCTALTAVNYQTWLFQN